ncbi:MAG TPA: toll/interleukin-1 receptor domain-containing protein [Thermoanaerobaculia bacterium]
MSYAPNQICNIFVSYAHVDDELLPGAEEGWVTTFVMVLRTFLGQRLGRKDAYSLWMDHQLARNVQITPQIMDALRDTSILLVILSPGYLASDWCQRERSAFLKVIKDRARSGSRVFIVERDRIEDSERPAEFSDMPGYCFWVQGRAGKSSRILGSPKPHPDELEYYQRVKDLSYELAQELQRLRKVTEPSGSESRIASEEGQPTIFLAEVTDDLDSERSSVRRYLDQAGIRVLPETYYPLEPSTFRRLVERDLEQSQLFVQLLSAVPGKKPPDLPCGYTRLQLDLALARGKPVIQWRNPELDTAKVEDPDQYALLEAETVHSDGIEDFKREIKRQVLKSKPSVFPPRGLHAFVFVDMEKNDRSLAESVCNVLESYGAEYALPIESDRPMENRLDLEENLLFSDGVIVIYGSSTVTWVREQLRQCRKILAKRETPLHAFAVFEGPPEEKARLDLKLHNMRIINCRKGLNEQELVTFLDGLQANGARA